MSASSLHRDTVPGPVDLLAGILSSQTSLLSKPERKLSIPPKPRDRNENFLDRPGRFRLDGSGARVSTAPVNPSSGGGFPVNGGYPAGTSVTSRTAAGFGSGSAGFGSGSAGFGSGTAGFSSGSAGFGSGGAGGSNPSSGAVEDDLDLYGNLEDGEPEEARVNLRNTGPEKSDELYDPEAPGVSFNSNVEGGWASFNNWWAVGVW